MEMVHPFLFQINMPAKERGEILKRKDQLLSSAEQSTCCKENHQRWSIHYSCSFCQWFLFSPLCEVQWWKSSRENFSLHIQKIHWKKVQEIKKGNWPVWSLWKWKAVWISIESIDNSDWMQLWRRLSAILGNRCSLPSSANASIWSFGDFFFSSQKSTRFQEAPAIQNRPKGCMIPSSKRLFERRWVHSSHGF